MRIRTNATNAIRQKITMRHNNDADDESTETEPTTEEIEDGMVPGEVVHAVKTDVIGLTAAVKNIPRKELLEGDVEEAQALAREVATTITAGEAVEAMKHPAFNPDDDTTGDGANDGIGYPGDDDGGMYADGGESDEAKANYAGVAGSVDRTNYDESQPDADDVSPGTLSGWRGESDDDGPGAGTLSDWESRQGETDDDSLARTPWQEKQAEKRRRGREMRLNAARKDAARRERDGE